MAEKVTKATFRFGLLKRVHVTIYLGVVSPLPFTMVVALSHILFSETEIVSVNTFLLQIKYEVGFIFVPRVFPCEVCSLASQPKDS